MSRVHLATPPPFRRVGWGRAYVMSYGVCLRYHAEGHDSKGDDYQTNSPF